MNKRTGEDRIWTIPNILSIFRMVLIPVFVWTYCGLKNDLATALVLLLSGISDTADGIIARRFNMITTLGKAIDPVADKLTQIASKLNDEGLRILINTAKSLSIAERYKADNRQLSFDEQSDKAILMANGGN